ncbi:hypothetical protein ACYOEI_18125 [Singulisphaera rosea]
MNVVRNGKLFVNLAGFTTATFGRTKEGQSKLVIRYADHSMSLTGKPALAVAKRLEALAVDAEATPGNDTLYREFVRAGGKLDRGAWDHMRGHIVPSLNQSSSV